MSHPLKEFEIGKVFVLRNVDAMPLILCPDCGKQISDSAANCIQCGRPMRRASPVARAIIKQQESHCSRGVYIILALFLGLLGIHNFYAGHYLSGAAQLILNVLLFWTIIVPIAIFLLVVMEILTVKKDGKGRPFK